MLNLLSGVHSADKMLRLGRTQRSMKLPLDLSLQCLLAMLVFQSFGSN